MIISFSVPGIPIAQPRIKATSVGGYVRVYTPKTADAYKATIALAFQACRDDPPYDGPVAVAIEFVMPRPKAMIWKSRPMLAEWHCKKPDIDNLGKAAVDSLLGLAWVDDSQVCSLILTKRVASGDESSRTNVEIKYLERM